MNTKKPPFFDISHWKEVVDFNAITPRPLLMGTKATEGVSIVDEKFPRFFGGMKQAGIRRLAYHFHQKAADPKAQALHFINVVEPYLTKDDIIALDVEDGGETAAQLITWYQEVMKKYPNNLYFLYSRKNILDPIPMFMRSLFPALEGVLVSHPLNAIEMTLAQREFFKENIITWTAGYPANPDLYDSVPSFYVPDQDKFGPVWAWQYSDKGVITGIDGSVDLNWMAPELIAWLGGVPPVNDDVITYPYKGIKRIQGTRYGWDFSLLVIDPAQVVYEVVHPSPLTVGTSIASKYNAQIVVNGGDWDKRQTPYLPLDYAVSNGSVYVPRKEYRPSFLVKTDGSVQIAHTLQSNTWQAMTGLRYIVIDGKAPSYLDDNEVQYIEGHSRAIDGIDSSGHHMRLTSGGVNMFNGTYPNLGLTLKQAAEIMIEYGAVTAFDEGGGGDVTEVIGGELQNVPEDESGGINVQRAIPQFLMIYADANDGGTMEYGRANENLGNQAVIRKTPSRYGVEVTRKPAYWATDFVEEVATIPQGVADKIGETWLKLPDGNFVNCKLFSGSILTDYFKITKEPVIGEPPASTFPASIETTQTLINEDGTQATYKGTLTKQ